MSASSVAEMSRRERLTVSPTGSVVAESILSCPDLCGPTDRKRRDNGMLERDRHLRDSVSSKPRNPAMPAEVGYGDETRSKPWLQSKGI
jgi:hypothetical protein